MVECMSKFKVGDKVRVLKVAPNWLKMAWHPMRNLVGSIRTVASAAFVGHCVLDGVYDANHNFHHFRNDWLELVEIESESTLDKQVGGDHYKKLCQYQPWEVLKAWLTEDEFRGYMKGTAIAYLARERDKGGMMDIEKATHTLQGLLELIGAKND